MLRPNELIDRWTTPVGSVVRECVVTALLDEGDYRPSLERLPGMSEVFDGFDLRGIVLTGLAFSTREFFASSLDFARLDYCKFGHAFLDNTSLLYTTFDHAEFLGTQLTHVVARHASFEHATFHKALLFHSSFTSCSFIERREIRHTFDPPHGITARYSYNTVHGSTTLCGFVPRDYRVGDGAGRSRRSQQRLGRISHGAGLRASGKAQGR
jgi:hypothetical protein